MGSLQYREESTIVISFYPWGTMLERILCPLTREKSEVIFSRPYKLKELQEVVNHQALSRMLEDKNYEIRYSPAAGIYFQTWVLEDHELDLVYASGEHCADFKKEIAAQKLYWFAHQAEEVLLFRQLCKNPLPTVLDFGCNWGKWASVALAYGCEVYGLDVNAHAIQFCSERGIKMVNFSQLDHLQFDFINCDQVLEHVSDPMVLLRQFYRSLKPGGFLKLSTPENSQLPLKLKKNEATLSNAIVNKEALDSLYPLVHINLFDSASLRTAAKLAGLQPFSLPLFKMIGAGQLWNIPRQLSRNFTTPFKRWRSKGAYAWFQKDKGQ